MLRYTADFRDGPLGFTLHTDSVGVHTVGTVRPNGQAAQIGIQERDKILVVGGIPIDPLTDHDELIGLLRAQRRPFTMTLEKAGWGSGNETAPAYDDDRVRDSLEKDPHLKVVVVTDDNKVVPARRDYFACWVRFVLLHCPAGVMSLCAIIAAILAPIEKWTWWQAFLYIASNICNLCNPLTQVMPTTKVGQYVDALTAFWAMAATVDNHTHTQ